MATETFTADPNERIGYGQIDNELTYSAIRDATTAKDVYATGIVVVGQRYASEYYSGWRGGVCFDTSGLDDGALIESATLTLKRIVNNNLDIFVIQDGHPTYPHKPMVVGDWDKTLYSGNGGSATAIATTVITLNTSGLSWINKTGFTKFMLRSANDINGITPTGNEYSYFDISDPGTGAGDHAKLTVVYFLPTGIPVVGDPTYSNTKATYTKATANITDAGEGYTGRGFEYGESESSTWAVRETGVWGATGDYSLTLPNLLPETTYYTRAYVTNSYGTGYSEWTSFTTTDVPSYNIYEESNSEPDSDGIYANSNTICFYLSEDDGHTWGQKHGPYTTDQADIEITKLLVRGSGKKKIKFTSDVLTGISASVMCKLDLKAR